MHQRSHDVIKRIYGENYSDVVIGYGYVGLSYHLKRNYNEAIVIYRSALGVYETLHYTALYASIIPRKF